MRKLLRIPVFLALLLFGGLLGGCVASPPAVVVAAPPRPHYGAYYRPAPRPYYRPARVVRPRAVIVPSAPRYYHARPCRGAIRY